MLSLRIAIGGDSGLVKTMRFTGNMSISEAIKEIREKLESGGEDHGLFQPKDERLGREARWLRLDRTFHFFNVQSGEELVYKKKHRPLKVRLMDDSNITVIVDDSDTVQELCDVIAEKLDLPNAEEYSLLRPDGSRWLDQAEPLCSQGIESTDVVLFKKRYFISDSNIDKSDPKQLNLFYHQCRKAIVNGEYPCGKEEATSFGALQSQINFGDYDSSKHNEKFLELEDNECLPARFRKKKTRQLVIREWQKLIGLKKLEAKYRYTKLCRSLATFGISLYPVGSPVPGKKDKFLKMLLGYSGKSIFRFNQKDGSLIEEIPLKLLRRWNAMKNEFTLDFEDRHPLGRYVVLCAPDVGEDMARHLAGYVDILLRIRKDNGATQTIQDAEEAELESVAPVFGDVVESVTTSIFLGGPGDEYWEEGEMGANPSAAQQAKMGERMVVTDLPTAANAAQRLLDDFDNQWLIDGSTVQGSPDELKQRLLEMASKLGKAVSDMVGGLDGPIDQVNIDAQGVAGQLKALLDAAKMAALGTDDQALLEAGRRVAQAVRDMLQASAKLSDAPEDMQAKRALQESIEALKGATAYIKGAVNKLLVDDASEQLLLSSAKRVADAVQKLAGNVNSAAKRLGTDDPVTQQLLTTARKAANSGRDVYQTAKIVAPVAVNADAQQQLLSAGKRAFDDAQLLASAANNAQLPAASMSKIAAAAKLVGEAMAQLVAATGSIESKETSIIENVNVALKAIRDGCEATMGSAGDAAGMSAAVKEVVQGRDWLLEAARAATTGTDDQTLLEASQKISGDIDKFKQASRDAIDNPKNMDYFKRLLDAAEKVANATSRLLGDNGQWIPYDHVRTCTKMLAAKATRLAETAKSVLPACQDSASQKALFIASKQGEAALQKIVSALRVASKASRDMETQNRFVSSIKATVPTIDNMCDKSNEAVPKIGDNQSKGALNEAQMETVTALDALKRALGKAQTTEDKAFEDINKSLQKTDYFLEGALLDARVGSLEQTMPRTQAIKNLGGALRNLANATTAGKKAKTSPELIAAATAIVQAVQHVADASTSVAASTSGIRNQEAIVDITKKLVPDVQQMLDDARARLRTPNGDTEKALSESAKQVSQRLKELLATTQGETGGEECDVAVRGVIDAVKGLNPRAAASQEPRQVLVEELNTAVKQLSSQANTVATVSRSAPKSLGPLVDPLPQYTQRFIESANTLAASSKDPQVSKDILLSTKSIGEHLVRLVGFAKTAKTDPQADESLTAAQANLGTSVKELLAQVSSATPGKKEFDEADGLLRSASDFSSDLPAGQYGLAALTTQVRDLRATVEEVMRAASREPEKLGHFSLQAAQATQGIVNNARGCSDVTQELAAAQVVQDNCSQIRRARTAGEALRSTKVVAQNAPKIMGAMKKVATSERDADVQKDLSLASQKVGPSLQELLKVAKEGAASGETEPISDAAEALANNLETLINAAPSSAAAHQLLSSTRQVAENVRQMGTAGAKVANRPMDGIAQTNLTVAAKETNTALDQLLAAATALSIGRAEVQDAMRATQGAIAELDSAAISAQVGLLQVPTSKTHQVAQETSVQQVKALAVRVQDLAQQARQGDMKALGLAAGALADTLEDVIHSAKETCGTTSDQDFQLKHLGLTKDIGQKLLAFLEQARDLTSEPSSKAILAKVADAEGGVRDSIQVLVNELRGGVMGLRACDEAIKSIVDSAKTLPDPVSTDKQYGELRDDVVTQAKKLAADVQDLYQTAKTTPGSVGGPSKQIAETVASVLESAKLAASGLEDPQNKKAVFVGAREVASTAAKMVGFSKKVAENPSAENRGVLNSAFKAVSNAMGQLVRAVKDADIGDKQSREAAGAISKVQADLDAASIFAETGQLQLGADKKPLGEAHKEFVAAVGDFDAASKELAGAAKKSNVELGAASERLARATEQVAASSKTVAVALGEFNVQKEVLSNAKQVAVRAQQQVLAAKAVNSHPNDARAATELGQKSTAVLAASKELLQHVGTVAGSELEHLRAIEGVQDKLSKQREAFQGAPVGKGGRTRDVIEASQEVAKVTAELLNVSGSGDKAKVLAAVNAILAPHQQLLTASAKVAGEAPEASVQEEMKSSTAQISEAISSLLEASKEAKKDDWEAQERITSANDAVGDAIADLAVTLKKLPGAAHQVEDDTLGLEVIAALEAAAASISADGDRIETTAAKEVTARGLDSSDVTAIVVNASKPIVSTTAQLVLAAVAQQHDLMAQARSNPRLNVYKKDPTWANNLIATARSVEAANGTFVSSVNELGAAGEDFDEELEGMEKSAKGVSSIAQKLVAQSKAKSDPNSPSGKKLTQAGHTVVTAIQALLAAARSAVEKAKEDAALDTGGPIPFDDRISSGELRLQLEIARLEKELETTQLRAKQRKAASSQLKSMVSNPLAAIEAKTSGASVQSDRRAPVGRGK